MLTERKYIFPKTTELATLVKAAVNNLHDLHVEPTQRMQSQLNAIEHRKGMSEADELTVFICKLEVVQHYNCDSLKEQA